MFVGINLAPTFSRRATHLLCPSGTGLKFEKACQWGIPVVDVHWLGKMAESGQVPGLDGFLVSVPTCGDTHAPEARITADDMVPDEEKVKDKKDLKGKGKAVERGKGRARDQSIEADIGDRMNDITNSKHLSFLLIVPLVSYIYIYQFRCVFRGPSSTFGIRESQAT
jgi:DNA replication regulator DPB11